MSTLEYYCRVDKWPMSGLDSGGLDLGVSATWVRLEISMTNHFWSDFKLSLVNSKWYRNL